ncbi:U4/U6.U5 tri-snRNP-associated protein 1 [Heterocephalus glaber]|uniref:U4/U6.U5 tri-snRNP-associated protein 1 n=1 Tax=Heterocephalus glaber TaxID=10181 RepID=G5BEA4_HETGA|nr:U4/U6.U5 tri-snRNP-associated protein 1 [Heterocephalus glaber]
MRSPWRTEGWPLPCSCVRTKVCWGPQFRRCPGGGPQVPALSSILHWGQDGHVLEDKYSGRELYCGSTQDFKEKNLHKPHVKIEYVDATGRKLTPKEASRQLSHGFHRKRSSKMEMEQKPDKEALLRKMSSSDTPLGTVALLQEKQKAGKTLNIVRSSSSSSKGMDANTITK